MTSLRARLLGGDRAVGLFVQTPHPVVAEVAGRLGPDVLCLDQEHAPFDIAAVHAVVGGAALAGVPALVRVPANTAHHIAAALDAGAAGVVVPRVESAGEAAAAAAFARYPPVGSRGLGPARSTGYGRDIAAAVARAADETLVAVQVETRRGVEAIDEILTVGEIDLVFVGPGDLAASTGLGGGALRDILDDVVTRTHAAGKAAGIYVADADAAADWGRRGVELILFGSDLGFLSAGVEAAWLSLRGAT